MIRLECPQCKETRPTIGEMPATACLKCGTIMVRSPLLPETTVRETVDNGLMGRRVETPADVLRLRDQRTNPLAIK